VSVDEIAKSCGGASKAIVYRPLVNEREERAA
jgi:hypothetical protein